MAAVFDDDFEVIEIDTESDEAELCDLFEEKTGRTLSAAHPEKILISIIAYAKSLILAKINECVKNLLLPYATGIWLDILGFLVGCERIAASCSTSTLEVTLYEVFSFDKTLPQGAQVETSDGQAVFETVEDLVIAAGETVGYVTVQSVQAGSDLNYGIGEINRLVDSYEFIESVTNTTACTGGANEEEDDSYRERIATAPEQFSVAGPEDAYIYFIKSAHSSIVDCSIVQPSDDVTVEIAGTTYAESDNVITADGFSAKVDYNACTVTITENSAGYPVTVKFPKQAELYCYILTEDGAASDDILEIVEEAVSADSVRPMTDYVQYFSAIENTFELNPTVYIERTADFDTVEYNVLNALNTYLAELKTKLNQAVLSSTLIMLIKNVAGVYDVDLGDFKTIEADPKIFNSGTVGDDISFERVN